MIRIQITEKVFYRMVSFRSPKVLSYDAQTYELAEGIVISREGESFNWRYYLDISLKALAN